MGSYFPFFGRVPNLKRVLDAHNHDGVNSELVTVGTPDDESVTNAKLADDVKVGSLADLSTEEKGSVVGAINEVKAMVESPVLFAAIENAVPAAGAGAVAATLDVGTVEDANGHRHTAKDAGGSGNGISVRYVDPGTPGALLSVGVIGNDVTANLATSAGTKASVVLGTNSPNGLVTVEADDVGEAGNALSAEVVLGVGNNQPLAAALADGKLTVTLATDGTGDPDDAANTANLVAAAVDAIEGLAAAAGGDGLASLSQAQAEAPFTGGADPAPITTAEELRAAFAAAPGIAGLITTTHLPGSDGSGVVAAMEATNLSGGADPKSVTGAEFNALVAKVNELIAAGQPAP